LGINFAWANENVFAVGDSNQRITPPTLELLAGLPKPPFIIEKNGAGLQLELIRQAFKNVEHSVNYTHVPFGRTITSFKRYNADGIAILPEDYQHPSIYVSKPYISYQNVAVSLADKSFVFDEVSGLKGKSIIAFQNAKKFLGEDYKANVRLSSHYREIADQIQQIDMLFSRRIEVIVLDINIFKYFVKKHTGGRYNQIFKIHYIFDEREYSAGFRSEQHRDLFDLGIARIKAQGLYQQILEQYL
jgi:polar amino acid transport system substrate-binding protein